MGPMRTQVSIAASMELNSWTEPDRQFLFAVHASVVASTPLRHMPIRLGSVAVLQQLTCHSRGLLHSRHHRLLHHCLDTLSHLSSLIHHCCNTCTHIHTHRHTHCMHWLAGERLHVVVRAAQQGLRTELAAHSQRGCWRHGRVWEDRIQARAHTHTHTHTHTHLLPHEAERPWQS